MNCVWRPRRGASFTLARLVGKAAGPASGPSPSCQDSLQAGAFPPHASYYFPSAAFSPGHAEPAHPPCPYPDHERGKFPVPGEYEEVEAGVMQMVPWALPVVPLTNAGRTWPLKGASLGRKKVHGGWKAG